MGRSEQTAVVDAFVPRVFFYCWPERLGAWYAPENGTRMEVVSPGGMGPGAKVRLSGESRHGPGIYDAEVVDWDPPWLFSWRVLRGAPRAEVSIRCEADGERTRVTLRHRYRVRPPILGALLDRWLVAPRVAAVDREAVSNLKALAEGKRGCA